MKNLKQILYNYHEKPPKGSWNTILSQLENKPKNVFNYWKVAAIALLCSNIGFFSYNYVNQNNTKDNNTQQTAFVNPKKSDTSNSKNTSENSFQKIKNNNTAQNKLIKNEKTSNEKTNQENIQYYFSKIKTQKNTFSENYYKNKIIELENTIDKLINEKEHNNLPTNVADSNTELAIDVNQLVNNELLFYKENKKIEMIPLHMDFATLDFKKEEEEEKEEGNLPKKWTVNAFYAPINVNTNSNRNAFLPEINTLSSEFSNAKNFGVKTSIDLNKTFFLRSGFEYLSFEQNTKNIGVTMISQNENLKIGNITYDGKLHLKNISQLNVALDLTNSQNNPFDQPGILNQQIAYSIIPVELGVKLFKTSKFNTNAVLGGSLIVLSENKLYFKNDFMNKQLGKANNLNSISYSTQLGLDFNYEIYKNLGLNLQPTFRYFFETFSSNLDTKPYTLGINAGINYKF